MGHQFFNNGPDPALAAIKAQFGLTGGGAKTVNADRSVRWTASFRVFAHGYHSALARNTSWFIGMPPDGTVVPNPTAKGDGVTVTGGRIPMGVYSTLWYILPLGGDGGFVPGNFRITSVYDNDDVPWEIPPHWIMIVTRNDVGRGNATVRWGTGELDDNWRTLSLLNGWVNYGEEWTTAQYRKGPGPLVTVRGLIRNGTANHIATLPEGFRPSATLLTAQLAADTVGRVDFRANGEVIRHVGSNTWVTVNATFHAEQ
ncbi:hypothetical protein ACQPW3_36220 [Actinosynnema sp. CA-248983]